MPQGALHQDGHTRPAPNHCAFHCFCGVSAKQLVIAPEVTAWRPQLAHMLRRVMDG
jgi:hypothetical protein